MMAGSHMLFGAAAWAGCAGVFGLNPADPVALSAAILGSLLPDIDHPQSWAGRKMRAVSVPLSAVFGHRGITHSLLAASVCVVLLGWFGIDQPAAPLIIGYVSHLAGDCLTPSGAPLLWPAKKRFTLNLFSTGSMIEIIFVGLIAAAAAWAAGIDPAHLPKPRL